MKLQYLGTAAAEAIPGLFCKCRFCERARDVGGRELRFRSGAVIDDRLMIDFSPDVYAVTLKLGIRLTNIENIIFTHSHTDHCNASDLLFRASGYSVLPSGAERLHTYGNRAVQSLIHSRLGGELEAKGLDFTFIEPYREYSIGGYGVTALSSLHANEDTYIYLIEKDGKRMLYGHDTGIFKAETFEYLRGKRCDLVSLDCTMGYQSTEVGHMGFAANVKVKNTLIQNKTADENTIFISHHFSHNGLRAPQGDLTYEKFSEMARPHNFIMSYDGMITEF